MAEDQALLDLPENLRPFFWDCDLHRLSWERSRHTIILRLLEKGGLQAIGFLRERMTDEQIRDFIVHRRGRGIAPPRLRFWALLVGIPAADVDQWIEATRRNPWHRRTQR